MAVKLPSFRLLPAAGAKSRVLVALLFVAGAAVGMYFLVQFLSGGSSGTAGTSQVAAAPEGLQSVPGGKLSPEYYRALSAANAEASRQAQMTGGSAVPTLVNVPVAQPAFPPQQNCQILCPDRTKIDVKADIDALVKSKKLTRKTGDALLDLANQNVTEEEFAANLDELVRQGKLTPAQARGLLEKYRKQRHDVLTGKSALFMDGMIRSGELSLNEANRLLALQKSGMTAAGYAAALKREVKEGRLNAQSSGKLLGQYTDLQMQQASAEGLFRLKQLVAKGAITQGVGDQLADMQRQNVGAKAYDAQLKKLVSDGRMTPATANELLKNYRDQRARTGSADALTEMIAQLELASAECVQKKVGQGGLRQSDADALIDLQQKDIDMAGWQTAVTKLEKEAKCTPDVAKQLIVCYQALAALREEAKRLQRLQADNASQRAYADELKRAVQSGLLKPAMAGDLMQEYTAIVTPVTAAAVIETSLPGAEDFARLQQQVQQKEVQPATSSQAAAQFATAELQAKEKMDAEREQRIQQIQTSMMTQAQTLLTSWQQPPTIQHVEAQSALSTKTGKRLSGASPGQTGGVGTASATSAAAAMPSLPPLIKSGTIYYAVLDTAVDSDYPDTPVMATIIQGPFNGSRVLGKLSLAQGQDRVSLSFNLMDADSWITAKTISAFAIDPDTARTVMATSVDHHYLKRYGGLFAASFLSGYSSAITNAGTSTTGIFGTSTSTPTLNPGNRLAVALGEVGKQFTSVVQQGVNTPATVRINSGVAIGIMFTADVTQS